MFSALCCLLPGRDATYLLIKKKVLEVLLILSNARFFFANPTVKDASAGGLFSIRILELLC